MCNEWTRENRIKEMDLNIKLSAVYLSGLSIAAALLIFIIGNEGYSNFSKQIFIPILIAILILLLLDYWKKINEIKKIFHGELIEETLQTNSSKKNEQDSQVLRNSIILICILLFFVFCWVVISLLSFNMDVSSFLIKGNISVIEENQGRGLLSLFNPFIGIFFALALFCLTVAYNTWSGSESNKKMSELNENIKDLKKKFP